MPMPLPPADSARDESSPLWAWEALPDGQYVGGNRVRLLTGGDELFPAMRRAIDAAKSQVWLATYIFHDDEAGEGLAQALRAAADRGVQVRVAVDGFGSMATLHRLKTWFELDGAELDVFRPLDRWWAWLQSGQLRRLHQKLCVVDDDVAFVGGINIIDDRNDLKHGRSSTPRLDFAVELRGPVVPLVKRMLRAISVRVRFGRQWRQQVRELAHSGRPVANTARLLRQMRGTTKAAELPPQAPVLEPVPVAFVVRDNLRQRRSIERRYIEAIRRSRQRVDIACPYFYPGRAFMRTLRAAAKRGVRVRLLLQGKADFRFAALAARVLYEDLMARGVHIYEYTPAFLHAKVALVDDEWSTVGSSNIDPLSLLLNMESNVVVRDADFTRQLAERFDQAVAASFEVNMTPSHRGWRRWLSHGFVAWCAGAYLRVAGISGRY
jgi:cardiolipin synthase